MNKEQRKTVFEHIWAHLFPYWESPVQLTWTISGETKTSWRGGCCFMARQHIHILLIWSPSLHSSTWFCVTFTSEFRLSPLDLHNHLHYSISPSSTFSLSGFEGSHPPPFTLLTCRPRQTETITATESKENTSAGRTAVLPLFFTLSFWFHRPAVQPTNSYKSFDTMTLETFQTCHCLYILGVCVCMFANLLQWNREEEKGERKGKMANKKDIFACWFIWIVLL